MIKILTNNKFQIVFHAEVNGLGRARLTPDLK